MKDIRNHSVSLVVICKDTSEGSKKKLIDKCRYYSCEYVIAFSQEEVMKVISRVDPVSGVGIKDSNLAKKLKENIEREGDVNGEK